ncbi:MAG: PDZ domain-containing protein [Planctomycetaceae bacterium]|jgi:tricorn protease|nr:PDZ domain-containing protein [Planctomycetaceae bacterium]
MNKNLSSNIDLNTSLNLNALFLNALFVTFILTFALGLNCFAKDATTETQSATTQIADTQIVDTQLTGTKLFRFPDIHNEIVVFCYGGDIWKANISYSSPSNYTEAVRLTAHEGQEVFPKISPDGKWIAFTGQYDGDEQVYVIPISGGIPRQLTFYPAAGPLTPRWGYDNLVYGWTPDGKNILFRSLRDSNHVTELGTLYTVPLDGGLPKKIGIPTAGAGDFSPDGSKIVYSPLFRDFRSWKRYEGGWTQYLAIFDLKTKETTRLDNNPRTEREPIWINDKIYFTSDRTGSMNLYEYNIKTTKITQLTNEKIWDVRWASGDQITKQIIFELGGELVVFETDATKITPSRKRQNKLTIKAPHDGLAMRPARIKVNKNIESYAAAPNEGIAKGRSAVIARGDLFVLPVDKGFVKNLTNTSNAHDREAAFSKDGSKIAFISDNTYANLPPDQKSKKQIINSPTSPETEDHIYIIDPKGEKHQELIADASNFTGRLTGLNFSPDGKFVSVNDSKANLYIIAIDDVDDYKKGIAFKVATGKYGDTPRAAWSPCGGYIAYVKLDKFDISSIYVWNVKTKTETKITNQLFDVSEPTWSPNGDYLYYLSVREFAPQISSVEWNFAGNRNVGIFALALRKNVKNPFAPQFENENEEDEKTKTDNAKTEETKNNDKKDNDKKDTKVVKPTEIDFDGLAERAIRVPVEADNISGLSVTEKYLVYVKRGAQFYGRESDRKPQIFLFDVKERKEKVLVENAGGYAISPDGKRLIYNEGGLKTIEVKPDAKPSSLPVDKMYADSVPAEEWQEIYREVWRKFRDYFYVSNMHGYDWRELGERYWALLPYVAHRSDLNYVISELISELNVGHAYIQGGDFVLPERPKFGLAGCRFELDEQVNLYKIAKIFDGENEESKYRSPLREVGVDARVGDYVLAIDGVLLRGGDNPYALLRNRVDPVTLTLNDKPEFEGSRKTTYKPIENEGNLIYLDFVTKCRETVDKATNGKVGYLHIPDMSAPGAYEFLKWYYPQIRKEGLIVDVRSNGGGNISQWIIMRMNQKLLGTRFGGVDESPDAYPALARHGHQVCLISETSASDGDIFPYYFREAGLGILIGKRTWGGVVGISPRGQLLDGGIAFVPLNGTNDKNGNWVIEGKGVTPNIEVDNDPKSMIEGKDLQLERGIIEIMKKIKNDPVKWPSWPKHPIKTKSENTK